MDEQIKDYIYSFVNEISRENALKAVILFGSVAKGTYTMYSDIDLFVIIDGNEFNFYNGTVKNAMNKIEKKHEKLIKREIYLSIIPMIVPLSRTKEFSPIFLDILDYGIVLYDRDHTAKNFIDTLSGIIHTRKNIECVEVLEWK